MPTLNYYLVKPLSDKLSDANPKLFITELLLVTYWLNRSVTHNIILELKLDLLPTWNHLLAALSSAA